MSFDVYWPYYLRHHTNRTNRLLHFLGWLVFLFVLASTLITGDILVLLFGVATAYVIAWAGHLVFERDIPETWRRPVLANIASLRMFVLMATGRLGDHLLRHGIVNTAAAPESKSNPFGAWLTLWLVFAYSAVLAALIVVRVLVGDRSALLFAINSLSLYGFVPLPLVIVAGVALRRASVLVVAAVGVLVWCWLWGGLFLPRASAAPGKPRIVVLSYNALGFNRDAADTIHVIRDSGADLVALQELNPETAHLIERELGTTYPHRWLEPRSGVTGSGILSKYPFVRAVSDALPGGWVSKPMVASVAGSLRPWRSVEPSVVERGSRVLPRRRLP